MIFDFVEAMNAWNPRQRKYGISVKVRNLGELRNAVEYIYDNAYSTGIEMIDPIWRITAVEFQALPGKQMTPTLMTLFVEYELEIL